MSLFKILVVKQNADNYKAEYVMELKSTSLGIWHSSNMRYVNSNLCAD